MTTHKGLKRLVRARMAKTGERYATARRAIVGAADHDEMSRGEAGDRDRGGLQPLSASLTNLLAARGIRAARTGRPLSEATILTIGGGLGAGYILWEFEARDGAILVLGFGNRWQYPGVPGWTGTTLERLGLARDVRETGGARGARADLDGILDRGDPVMAWIEQQALGTWGLPDDLSGVWGYPVVVAGRGDDGAYLVDDRAAAPFRIDAETMARARARIGSYRHRLLDVREHDLDLSDDRLRTAVRTGLEDQVAHLRAPSDSFSLPAWRKWARLMTDTRHPKGWPTVFADGMGLFGALLSIVEGVDGDIGADGGNLRALFADGLDEAAALLDLPRLGDAADHWRSSADLWEELADAAVPADLPDGLEAIEAAERLHAAVMQGEPGRAAAHAAAGRMWALRSANRGAVDLPPDRIGDLLEDIGRRVREIYDAEVTALDVTAEAIGAG